MIEILLGVTYYNQNFFNIGVAYTNLLADHGAPITIQLGENPENIVQGQVNRTANRNYTPRIMGGVLMTNWIQKNYNLYGIMSVQVLNPQRIKLLTN